MSRSFRAGFRGSLGRAEKPRDHFPWRSRSRAGVLAGAAAEHRDVGSPLVRQQALIVESVGGQRSQPLRERCEVLRRGQLARGKDDRTERKFRSQQWNFLTPSDQARLSIVILGRLPKIIRVCLEVKTVSKVRGDLTVESFRAEGSHAVFPHPMQSASLSSQKPGPGAFELVVESESFSLESASRLDRGVRVPVHVQAINVRAPFRTE